MQFENKAQIARIDDPETSHIAGEKLTASGRRSSWKYLILAWMLNHDIDCWQRDLTPHEFAKSSGIPHPTIHKRLPDLLRDGKVVKSRQRTCRVSKEEAWAWMLAPEDKKETVKRAQGSLF